MVEKRPIKVGFSNKTIAIVEEGLAPGEKIVTDGQYRIQSGTRVNVLPQQAEIAVSPAGDSESLGTGQ